MKKKQNYTKKNLLKNILKKCKKNVDKGKMIQYNTNRSTQKRNKKYIEK